MHSGECKGKCTKLQVTCLFHRVYNSLKEKAAYGTIVPPITQPEIDLKCALSASLVTVFKVLMLHVCYSFNVGGDERCIENVKHKE